MGQADQFRLYIYNVINIFNKNTLGCFHSRLQLTFPYRLSNFFYIINTKPVTHSDNPTHPTINCLINKGCNSQIFWTP